MRKFCFYLLLVFVFSVPWQNAISIGGTRTLVTFLGIGVISLTVLVCMLERRVRRPKVLFLAYAVFVLWQLTTYFWSIDQSSTLEAARTSAQLLGMIWLIHELCPGERERLAVMQAFVAGCWVVCLILASAYASGQTMDGYRYAPDDFSLNGAADTLALGIAMVLLVCTRTRHGLAFWLNVGYIPVALVAVVLTASRSGFVATCIACLGVVFLLRRTRVVYRLAWVAVILGLGVGLFLGLSGSQRLEANVNRIILATDRYSLGTLSGRTDIWAAGLNVFGDHPIAGVGASVFPLAVQQQLGSTLASHNLFVQTAAESGLIGLLLLGAVFAAGIIPAFRRGNTTGLSFILLAVAMVMALVANVQVNKSFWLVIALLAIGDRVSLLPATSGVEDAAADNDAVQRQSPSRA